MIPICTCCKPDCDTCFPNLDFTDDELAEAQAALDAVRPEDCVPYSEEEIDRMVENVMEADRRMRAIRESN